ncbi:MAG: glycosyltransferase family 4 protein [Flammeovirgaceae bacterium]|nr:MAG: glycosyltransferase family 4 protein [Flammeovirgaceae bacterium]
MRIKLLRITTVPESLHVLLKGQLEYMQHHGFDVLAVSSKGIQVENIIKAGINHRSVLFTRRITPFTDLIALLQLVWIIIRFNPTIVHTHTPKAGLLGMMAALICRVPVRMHTVAGLPLMEAKGAKRWLLYLSERVTYCCAHKIYPNSKGLMDYINLQFKVQDSKMKIIGHGSSNGIDARYFSKTPELEREAKKIREQLNVDPNGMVFGFVGRIVRDKGLKELIAAFRNLNNNRNKLYLLLVGQMEVDLDPLDEVDRRYIDSANNVFLVGYQTDVRPWMIAMDVFVFPSYREGFPNVVMQAACLELPCIVSDINGCNEIIQHQVTGIVVPVKNVDALIKRMTDFINSSGLWHQFGVRAREFVVQHFEQRLVWDNLLKEYKYLLGNK